MSYDFRAIESRWQAHWKQNATFRVAVDPERPKLYVLDMFPYPSGEGLHVGHPAGYTATDTYTRYKRMRGFNVLHPMGWDAFGLPAERFAIKTGMHPAARTAQCIATFKRQLEELGFSYDWSRELDTTDPRYYRWTQWIFLQMWGSWYDAHMGRARPIEELPIPDGVHIGGERAISEYRDAHRIAYLHEAPVNWCSDLRVVLANEEVAEHVEAGHEVVRRPMKQWMMRITAYAERLLSDLEGLEWPPNVIEMQRNWIGRSEGAQIDFHVADTSQRRTITVFTTRPDTVFGATYMVLAPEHPWVTELTGSAQREQVAAYVQVAARRSERERQAASAEGHKTGVFTGAYVLHPFTGTELPIWIADYVLLGYGTGAIMAVPAHDERDHALAKQYGLPIAEVVAGGSCSVQEQAFVGEGKSVNSDFLNGLDTTQAKRSMIDELVRRGLGRARVTYKLRDWLFSRQRYWGEPFPLLHRPDGTIEAVPDDQLPVRLPELDDYSPSETGEPPLAKAKTWRELPDGSLREVNTMPQWAGSCWYYLRFLDPHNDRQAWSKEAERYWMPVDLYVGGAEHAVLHLLYARFWHKVLYDLGHVSTKEPFARLINQGMVLGASFFPRDRRRDSTGKRVSFRPDEVEPLDGDDGQTTWKVRDTGEAVDIQWDKMSKSRGNVISTDDVVNTYGADTLRLYEMFLGPLEHSAAWQQDGVVGCHRFLQRVHRLFFEESPSRGNGEVDIGNDVGNDVGNHVGNHASRDRPRKLPPGEGTLRQRQLLHRTIHDVTERSDRLAFNTAISAMMVFVRDIATEGELLCFEAGRQFCLLLAPLAPHLAEEIWAALGHTRSLAYEPWPAADEAFLDADSFALVVQINGKWRAEVQAPRAASQRELEALARALPQVQSALAGRSSRRVVVVPGRLVNFVV